MKRMNRRSEMGELLKLQNGSDVRGIAAEGIEGQHVNLTPDDANVIAQAFVLWLSKKKGKRSIQPSHRSRA